MHREKNKNIYNNKNKGHHHQIYTPTSANMSNEQEGKTNTALRVDTYDVRSLYIRTLFIPWPIKLFEHVLTNAMLLTKVSTPVRTFCTSSSMDVSAVSKWTQCI